MTAKGEEHTFDCAQCGQTRLSVPRGAKSAQAGPRCERPAKADSSSRETIRDANCASAERRLREIVRSERRASLGMTMRKYRRDKGWAQAGPSVRPQQENAFLRG